jgi:chemotaxis protein methyltransferase CheR
MSLSRASFEYARALLRQRSGQQLEDDKGYLVETRLAPLAHRLGLPSVEILLTRLAVRPDEALLAEVVELMTINETFFFRDTAPFEALRRRVLPELVGRRTAERRLTVWCAACSSGQEPYSVAMLLGGDFPALAGWEVRLIASDLSGAMLERARRGLYSRLEVSRGLPADLLRDYFEEQTDGWRIKDDIRRSVEFRSINLSGGWPELPLMDLILLRNVLIYFDAATKQRILAKVRQLLRPDGYLMLGAGETTQNLDDSFAAVQVDEASFFRPRPRPAT